MERLTKRDYEHSRGNAYFPECFKEPCCGCGCKKEECTFFTQVCEKLAYYEDLAEQEEARLIMQKSERKSENECCEQRNGE